MDYKTKGTSRRKIRVYAKYFRELFDVPQTGPFPVLEVLDKIPDVFENCNYEVVDDQSLSANTMAACTPNEAGGFIIEIKESVYNGAYENNNGACRSFITHEMCHVFLFKIGYTPLFERSFHDGELPPYCSVEWQAKAMCGEVMIPYEESEKMTQEKMIEIYHVSKESAKMRKKIGRK